MYYQNKKSYWNYWWLWIAGLQGMSELWIWIFFSLKIHALSGARSQHPNCHYVCHQQLALPLPSKHTLVKGQETPGGGGGLARNRRDFRGLSLSWILLRLHRNGIFCQTVQCFCTWSGTSRFIDVDFPVSPAAGNSISLHKDKGVCFFIYTNEDFFYKYFKTETKMGLH